MKSYRNAIAALVLAFVFSTSTFADDGAIWMEKTPPPPPPTTNGAIWMEAADPASEEDSLTEIALTLLQTLLPLL
ncbi:MAG TPA: hypothetical protein VEX70_13285 [Pyrinomonadaceae bacterium]|nr:hypothetical protein [Pyrinomonadaceae bacterium]